MGANKSSTTRCLHCRKQIPKGGRRHRKFCKAGCRTLAYRARRRATLQGDDAPLKPIPSASESSKPPEAEETKSPHASGATHVIGQQVDSPSGIVEIVTELNRQHEETSAALQRLLDLVRAAQQREADLRQELDRAQEALRRHIAEGERLQSEVADLREQTTKREQAERSAEDVRLRLLQVERYITVLTAEQQQRHGTAQAQLDEQLLANESLRGDLASSSSQVRELEATVQQMRDKQAEQTQHLEDSQKRLADTEQRLASREEDSQKRLADTEQRLANTEQRLASREEEVRQIQRQHAERTEADRLLISGGIEQRTALEAEVRRLRQNSEAQQAASRRPFSEAARRLTDLVSNAQSTESGHAEQVARLTAERDVAGQQYQRLVATIGEMVPFPVGRTGPFTTHAAPLKTRLKNPLVYFLEPAFARAVPLAALDENLMLLAVLFAQGRVNSMLIQTPGQSKEASSEVLVRHVVECLEGYAGLFPKETRAWAEEHAEALPSLERTVTAMVRRQLTRVLTAAPGV